MASYARSPCFFRSGVTADTLVEMEGHDCYQYVGTGTESTPPTEEMPGGARRLQEEDWELSAGMHCGGESIPALGDGTEYAGGKSAFKNASAFAIGRSM